MIAWISVRLDCGVSKFQSDLSTWSTNKIKDRALCWKHVKLWLMFLKPIWGQSDTMAKCIVLLIVTISIEKPYSHNRVTVIGNDIEVNFAIQIWIHRYQGIQCTWEKHYPHSNSLAKSLKFIIWKEGFMNPCCLRNIAVFLFAWWRKKWDNDHATLFQSSRDQFRIPWVHNMLRFLFFCDTKAFLDGLLLWKNLRCSVLFRVGLCFVMHLHRIQL